MAVIQWVVVESEEPCARNPIVRVLYLLMLCVALLFGPNVVASGVTMAAWALTGNVWGFMGIMAGPIAGYLYVAITTWRRLIQWVRASVFTPDLWALSIGYLIAILVSACIPYLLSATSNSPAPVP